MTGQLTYHQARAGRALDIACGNLACSMSYPTNPEKSLSVYLGGILSFVTPVS